MIAIECVWKRLLSSTSIEEKRNLAAGKSDLDHDNSLAKAWSYTNGALPPSSFI